MSLYPTAVNSRTLVAQIANTLCEGVTLGHLRLGERIRLDDFATQLGVTRPGHIFGSWKRRDADADEREVALQVLTAVISLIQRLAPAPRSPRAMLQVWDRFQLGFSDE